MNDIYWIILAVIFGLCFTGAFLYTLFLSKKKTKKTKDKEE